ncbi:RlmE family RNA methyltransferase [Candidatus Nucleicultrix amoebiphila]|uniref:RlmE family RNA methyltransferase n=1 Tax=Candidatus Nucleicultrix amoebiphila TaxID=1509244 RepID=UPI0018DB03D8|nr:RlmE family RNA methyltransferase [Candidatus Nucleicultrix amoebiphila]
MKNSSKQWLQRQLNDPYVFESQRQGLRSRSSFKLKQIDENFKILKPNARVVDLGAAPGGWLQIAVMKTQSKSENPSVIGIDLLEIEPLKGTKLIQGDFLDKAVQESLLDILKGPVDVVLSDMAANTTGHATTDHLRTLMLAEEALQFALNVLKPGGTFVSKFFQGGGEKDFMTTLKKHFRQVKFFKPDASRKESSEMYLVAQGFRKE